MSDESQKIPERLAWVLIVSAALLLIIFLYSYSTNTEYTSSLFNHLFTISVDLFTQVLPNLAAILVGFLIVEWILRPVGLMPPLTISTIQSTTNPKDSNEIQTSNQSTQAQFLELGALRGVELGHSLAGLTESVIYVATMTNQSLGEKFWLLRRTDIERNLRSLISHLAGDLEAVLHSDGPSLEVNLLVRSPSSKSKDWVRVVARTKERHTDEYQVSSIPFPPARVAAQIGLNNNSENTVGLRRGYWSIVDVPKFVETNSENAFQNHEYFKEFFANFDKRVEYHGRYGSALVLTVSQPHISGLSSPGLRFWPNLESTGPHPAVLCIECPTPNRWNVDQQTELVNASMPYIATIRLALAALSTVAKELEKVNGSFIDACGSSAG